MLRCPVSGKGLGSHNTNVLQQRPLLQGHLTSNSCRRHLWAALLYPVDSSTGETRGAVAGVWSPALGSPGPGLWRCWWPLAWSSQRAGGRVGRGQAVQPGLPGQSMASLLPGDNLQNHTQLSSFLVHSQKRSALWGTVHPAEGAWP